MAYVITLTSYDSTSVTAHIEDQDTSSPVTNQVVQVKEGTTWSSNPVVGGAMPDANGDVTITGLIPGREYKLWCGGSTSGPTFTTPAYDYKVPTTAQWQDLATRVKNNAVTVVQSIGKSTTDVMSQKAVSDEIFYNSGNTYTREKIRIGHFDTVGYQSTSIGYNQSFGNLAYSVAIGANSSAGNDGVVIVGNSAVANKQGAVAIGYGSSATTKGEMNIGTSSTQYGYNSSNYRLLSGLYDPQADHDAATKGYVDTVAPVITMTSTDPGEGGALAANNFIAVYSV